MRCFYKIIIFIYLYIMYQTITLTIFFATKYKSKTKLFAWKTLSIFDLSELTYTNQLKVISLLCFDISEIGLKKLGQLNRFYFFPLRECDVINGDLYLESQTIFLIVKIVVLLTRIQLKSFDEILSEANVSEKHPLDFEFNITLLVITNVDVAKQQYLCERNKYWVATCTCACKQCNFGTTEIFINS